MSGLIYRRAAPIFPYILILPAFALIVIFRIYPIISTIIESVYVNNQFTLSVYTRLFQDNVFWQSFWVTVRLNAVMIPFQIAVAFMMALLVNATVKGIGGFRTLIYLPFTLSLPVATILWNMMLNPNNGIVNSALGLFGIPPQGFLVSASQAIWSVMVIASWSGCAYWMMFFLAGLKGIDSSIYESAKIDGASWLRQVFSVTLPLLKHVFLFVFVANTAANILLFVPMQIITGGGPQRSTNVLMFEAYQSAFRFADRPRSAAIVTILLFLIVLISFIQFRLLKEKDDITGAVR